MSYQTVGAAKDNGFARPSDARIKPIEPFTPEEVEPAPEADLLPRREAAESKVRFTVDLPVHQHRALQREALERGVKMTVLVRYAIADLLARSRQQD